MRHWFLSTAILLVSLARGADERAPLERERVLEALQRAIEPVQAEIDLIEYSSFPVPPGEILFEWSGLTPITSPLAATRWKGVVQRPTGERFSIWAIVRLEADVVRLIATESISVGQVIRAEQVKEEVYRGFPSKDATLRLDEVVGKVALRPIRALSTIRPEQLSAPYAIRRGSSATADYRDGAIHLRVPVVAEQDGHVGDRIRVKSERQKTLYAIVLEDGSLQLTTGSATAHPALGRSSTK